MAISMDIFVPKKANLEKKIDFQNASLKDQKNIFNQTTEKPANVPNQLSNKPLDKYLGHLGPGLLNMGNTCFLNSVIQCLTYTQPLQKFLLNSKHKFNCKRAQFCSVCTFEDHIKKCLSMNTSQAIMPKQFVANLKKIAKHFRNGKQEDSHEFLRFLVDGMVYLYV
jgi:ubiquitin C-terminal hydrolase